MNLIYPPYKLGRRRGRGNFLILFFNSILYKGDKNKGGGFGSNGPMISYSNQEYHLALSHDTPCEEKIRHHTKRDPYIVSQLPNKNE